jgi:Uma2 family endonuclease
VSVFSRKLPIEQVFTRPQLIEIEVLFPEDRHYRVAEKIKNYMKFGVQSI